MKKNFSEFPIILVIIILGGVLVFWSQVTASSLIIKYSPIITLGGTNIGDNATDFSLQALNGSQIRLDKYFGKKALILNFWSTSCTPCSDEFLQFQRIRNFYGDRIEILGVNFQDANIANVAKFGNDIRIDFPILLDPTGEVKQAYDVSNKPTTYFININGIIVDKGVGTLTSNEIDSKVNQLIKTA